MRFSMSVMLTTTSWTVLIATLTGLVLARTPLARIPGPGPLAGALLALLVTEADGHEQRLAALRELQVGDLVYIPGHVMMVIGHDGGMPYVIHDTTGITYRDNGGAVARVHLNGVSVTPLTALLLGEDKPLADRIYSIQRIRH